MKKKAYPKAIVLVSGGLDSALTAALASDANEVYFLHANYGQRTEKKELYSFRQLAKHYRAKDTLEITLAYLKQIGNSSLTDRKITVTEANLDSKEIPSSYVPFRNANLLSVAVSWAESIGATKIYIGATEEDSSGYPDCRRNFFESFNRMIRTGTKPGSGIRVVTPIIGLTKKEIVRKCIKLNVPVELTWSCYKSSKLACGVCDSCALRLRGFQLAGETDRIPYRKMPDYAGSKA